MSDLFQTNRQQLLSQAMRCGLDLGLVRKLLFFQREKEGAPPCARASSSLVVFTRNQGWALFWHCSQGLWEGTEVCVHMCPAEGMEMCVLQEGTEVCVHVC